MNGFGGALRAERERLGLSIEAVCERTKIPPHHLSAVEADELDRLPGGVFRRGILRAYLAELHLAEDPEWMARLQQCLRDAAGADSTAQAQDWSTFAQNVRRGRTAGNDDRSGLRWLGVLLMVLTLLAVSAAVWFYLIAPRLP